MEKSWNEHKEDLERVLTEVSENFGEPYVANLIATTLANMKTKYSKPHHTLCATIKSCMREIDPSKIYTDEIAQMDKSLQRLSNQIK